MLNYIRALKSLPKFVYSSLKGIPVFYGHEVGFEAFESLCRFLANNNYQTLSADEYYQVIKSGEASSASKKIVLTFDDGRRNNWAIVYPLLKKYNLKAIFFIIPPWIKEAPAGINLNDYWQGRIGLDKIYQNLRDEPYLTWPEVQEMSQSGVVDIQSHGLYHQLCFTDKVLIDFQYPKSWGTPAYGDIWTAYDKKEPEALWGAPVYPTAWSETVERKYLPDLNLLKLSCNYVSENGGIEFYRLSDWKTKLHRIVNDYRKTHQMEDNFAINQTSSPTDIRNDLETARLSIETKCRKKVNHLALPYHRGNQLIYQAAKEAGYKTIFNGLAGIKLRFITNEEVFHIGRIQMRWAIMLPGKGRLTLPQKMANKILGRHHIIEE